MSDMNMSNSHTRVPGVDKFDPELKRIVGRALDGGLYYLENIKAFVASEYEGFQAEPVLVQTLDYSGPDHPDIVACNEGSLQLEARIAELPVGNYAIVDRSNWNNAGYTFLTYLVSTGQGRAYTSQPSGSELKPADVIAKMASFEVYLCERQVREDRAHAQAVNFMTQQNVRVGDIYVGKVRINSRNFSKLVVKSIEGTQIAFILSGKGPGKFESTLSASKVASFFECGELARKDVRISDGARARAATELPTQTRIPTR